MTTLLFMTFVMEIAMIICTIVVLGVMFYLGDLLMKKRGAKPVRSWTGKVITMGIIMIGLFGVSFADDMDCFRFETVSNQMDAYQREADRSKGFKRTKYLKRIEKLVPTYWELGNLCFLIQPN